jgi:DNA-binding transcriptional MocR family regulator
MRLSFGAVEIDQIGEAIKRLALVVRSFLG